MEEDLSHIILPLSMTFLNMSDKVVIRMRRVFCGIAVDQVEFLKLILEYFSRYTLQKIHMT